MSALLGLEVVLSLVAGAVMLTLYLLLVNFSYWRRRGVATVPGPLPLVGSMGRVLAQRDHAAVFFQRLYSKYATLPFVGFFQGHVPTLLVRDPELIHHILIKDFSHFTDHGLKFSPSADILMAKNMLNMQGEKWKAMRAKLTPTFTTGRMKAMFPELLDTAKILEKCLENLVADGPVDCEIKDYMVRFATFGIISSFFGVNCDIINNVKNDFHIMNKMFSKTDVLHGFGVNSTLYMPGTATPFRFTLFKKNCDPFFRSLVRNMLGLRPAMEEKRKDFMQLLIELKDEKDRNTHPGEFQEFTDEDLIAQAFMFYFAGFETTSTTLTMALLELAHQPELQRRARSNIEEVLARHQGQLTYQALQKMTYLDWILQETLRLYPPMPSLFRECTKNYVIPGTQIMLEKGTPLIIPMYALQRDAKYFPKPEMFEPERFSKEQSEASRVIYMPFGEGPRQCIGLRFAYMQGKLGLLAALRHFQVSPVTSAKHRLTLDARHFLFVPNETIQLKLEKISK